MRFLVGIVVVAPVEVKYNVPRWASEHQKYQRKCEGYAPSTICAVAGSSEEFIQYGELSYSPHFQGRKLAAV